MNLRREVLQSISWKIVSELFRHYHAALSLRIYETHPGGGLYDCLSLFLGDFGPSGLHPADFNQQSGNFHVWNQYRPSPVTICSLKWPRENSYAEAYRWINASLSLMGFN